MDSMHGMELQGSTIQWVRGNGSQFLSSCATSPRIYRNDSESGTVLGSSYQYKSVNEYMSMFWGSLGMIRRMNRGLVLLIDHPGKIW